MRKPIDYVYVNLDGSVRELTDDEKDYLSEEFHPLDGAQPYIKQFYYQLTPDHKIHGFLRRDAVPPHIAIGREKSEERMKVIDKLFKLFLLIGVLLGTTSCVSRMSRPVLTGVVVDENGRPLPGVQVGESLTDSNGCFSLEEIRYNKFFLTELFVMEAPPVYVEELVSKSGFKTDTIRLHSPFGGGAPKGTLWSVDTLRLVRDR